MFFFIFYLYLSGPTCCGARVYISSLGAGMCFSPLGISRSKFPDNPEATLAFQKVSVAYDVLSSPASKRLYDSHPAAQEFSSMGSSSSMRAEETLRSVVIGVFNDFLDGDMELVHTLLREYFWMVFRQGTMPDTSYFLPDRCDERYQSIATTRRRRHRVCSSHAPSHPRTSPECALPSLCLFPSLTTDDLIAAACRVFTHTLLGTLSHLLETHASLSQLSYLSIRPRARLTLRLVRIILGLPLALEDAVDRHRRARSRSRARRRRWHEHEDNGPSGIRGADEEEQRDHKSAQMLPRRMLVLIEGLVVVLERMETALQ